MLRGKHLSVVLILAAIILVGTVTQGCVTSGQYNRLKEQLERANETIDIKDQRIEELDHEVLAKQEELLAMKDQLQDVDKYRKNSEKAAELISDLEEKLALATKELSESSESNANPDGVEIYIPDGDSVGIRLPEQILFDSGSDTLKTNGLTMLDSIIPKIKSSQKVIRIAGHTDTDPVVKTIDKYPRGNIQLSTARAISIWEYFKKKGIPESRMCVEGHGSAQPLTNNDSAEGKQRNRRVEIILSGE